MGPIANDTSVSDVKRQFFQRLFGFRGKLKQRINQDKERWKEMLIFQIPL